MPSPDKRKQGPNAVPSNAESAYDEHGPGGGKPYVKLDESTGAAAAAVRKSGKAARPAPTKKG